MDRRRRRRRIIANDADHRNRKRAPLALAGGTR